MIDTHNILSSFLSSAPDASFPNVFPVTLALVAYIASNDPSNSATIMTLADNPAGLVAGTSDSTGVIKLPDFAAAYSAALPGYPAPQFCDINNLDGCPLPGPGVITQVADHMLVTLTFNDGTVAAGFNSFTPNIPYPDPSDDRFYVGTFNGSYQIGTTPILPPPNDVTLAVFDNFDDKQNWGLTVLTTFNSTPTPSATGFSIVAMKGANPITLLNLNAAVNWNDPVLADTGYENDTAFQYPQLTAAMKANGFTTPTQLLGAVTTTAGGVNYVNYFVYDPDWVVDPNQSLLSPSPSPPDSPTPPPRRSPPKRKSPPPKRKSPPPKKGL